MSQDLNNSQRSLAWFHIARLISQGEKEKALGMYKLLSYSFEDKAFALQVEGDVLFAFEDKEAMTKYFQAAFLYKKESKIVSAVAIYETILTLDPKNFECVIGLIEGYAILNWQDKLYQHTRFLLDFFDKNLVSQDHVIRAIKIVADQFSRDRNIEALVEFKDFLATNSNNLVEYITPYL